MAPALEDLINEKLKEENEEDLLDFMSECGGDDDEDVPQMDASFPTSVFICNLPKVAPEKFDKLMTVLRRIITKSTKDGCDDFTVHMPNDESTGLTFGFMIITFQTAQQVDECVEKLDGHQLDKANKFKVLKLDKFENISRRSEQFTPKSNVQHVDRSDHRDWLEDPSTREQFIIRHGAETEIYWHDTLGGEPVLYYGGEREKAGNKIWCDWKVCFSPQGSYIATMHKPGIALWAGHTFEKKIRFAHQDVKHLEFSPNEEFMLTWNGAEPGSDPSAVRIFNVLNGYQPMKQCFTPSFSPHKDKSFPHFLWSKDAKYFAECNDSTIMVRDTKTFDLITDEEGRKRTLKYDNLDTFQWSPKDNIIALWTLEKADNPARLVIVEIPSRAVLRAHSRTQVEAKMHWQSEGDYLCLLVTKLSKAGKRGSTNLEIFRIREKEIPVEIVEVRQNVKAFRWETGGNRFAIITTDDSGHKPKLEFFVLGKAKCENVCSIDLPSNSFSDIYWAPGGQYFVCAAMQTDGDLIFGGLMPDNKLEILCRDEHFMINTVEWDPSSRYVITAVTQPMAGETGGIKYQMEAGYALWTFQGRQLQKVQKEKLYHIAWRQHPASMLSDAQTGQIRKDLKKYSKKYDAMDEKAKDKARQAFREDRETRTNAFLEILDRIADNKERCEEENGWTEGVGDLPNYQEGYWEKVETMIEEELDATEELIQ
jgi:translation initiation factor 3 subunit B